MSLDRPKYYCYFKAFALAALTGALFIIPFMLKGGGVFYLGVDYIEQQVPFITYCNEAIKAGDVLWSPVTDLGTGFVSGYAFYCVGSPFFWLSLLFDAKIYYLLSPFFYILKMGVSGLTAFAFIKQYVKTPDYAIAGGLIYTFCGTQIANLNFHFYDYVALFPLILLTLDCEMQGRKRGSFALCVALLAATNVVNFAAVAVFTAIYFVVKLLCREYKLTVKRFLSLACETLLGAGLSAIITLPAISLISSNARAHVGFASLGEMLLLKPVYWSEFIRSQLMPAECIFNRSMYMQVFTNTPELYIPLFGMVLAFAWLFANRKHWRARLLCVCAVFAVIPVLNSAFSAFNAEYYPRWLSMPLLILALATASALENRELSLKPGYIYYGALWALFGACYVWFTYYFRSEFFHNLLLFAVFALISLAGFGFTLLCRKIQAIKHGNTVILAALMCFCALTGAINVYYHQKNYTAEQVKNLYTVNEQVTLPTTDEGYRITSSYLFNNTGVMLGESSNVNFTSVVSPSIVDFYDACGVTRTVSSFTDKWRYGYQSFLSCRYWVYCQYPISEPDAAMFETIEQQGGYYVGDFKYAVPMGYTFDKYMLEQDFRDLGDYDKHLALLKGIILTPELAAKYSDTFDKLGAAELSDFSFETFQADVAARKSESCSEFESTKTGYRAAITLSRDNLVFFTIPADEGWSVSVNGVKVQPEKTDFGFIAVPCQAGENEIVFSYMPTSLKAGIALSAASALGLCAYMVVPLAQRKRRKTD